MNTVKIDMGATAMLRPLGTVKRRGTRGTVEERVERDWEAVARDFGRAAVNRDR